MDAPSASPRETAAARGRLREPCRFLKGVGPRRAECLERLGIHTVGDLLLHAPRTYMDRSNVQDIADLRPGSQACIRVRIESLHARPPWRGRRSVQGMVSDATGRLRVTWYGGWVQEALRPGHRVILAGEVVERRGRLEMRAPEFEHLEADGGELVHAGRIVPFYPLTRGVTQKWLRGLIARTLDTHADAIVEFLPDAVRGDLPERREACRNLHFPPDRAACERALERFKLEELFLLQLLLARRRLETEREQPGLRLQPQRDLHTRYLESLPFRLTAAQRRTLDEILADLGSGRWMQRLVQGDVGSGKTVVAVAALLAAVDAGYQGVLMAPTESLALQHAERLVRPCAALGVRLGVLVGSRTETQKADVRARMASGDVDLVVGTHAIIQEGMRWSRLGLAVVDEQQRFGVLQRGVLQDVSQTGGDVPPHVLVLTATPIPRSLALTVFGDLDVSRLDEKPPGRTPVSTHVVPPAKRSGLWGFVREQLDAGGRAYVILPLIEESDKVTLRAATEEYERLRAGPLMGQRLGLLHGRLGAAEKESLLRAFQNGDLQVLVSTTVVEVGIDVAEANLMILYHPERFGLSQLHQLRGRVGRGRRRSWCFLLPEGGLSQEAFERLRAFAATEDGFRIAELDLRLRGPGDFLGTRQHGLPTLRFAQLAEDVRLLETARDAALRVTRDDPGLDAVEHRELRAHLESHWQESAELARIG